VRRGSPVKLYGFKLHDYNEDYYRIYERARHVELDKIPSFRLLKQFLSVKPDERILDAGCGVGHLLDYLLTGSSARGIGVDHSAAALRTASSHFPRSLYSRQDLTAIGLKDGAFDKIICFNAIEHIANQEQVMWEFDRLLKPGGHLVIGTNIKDSLAWWLYQFFIGEHTHVREFAVNEFLEFVGRYFEVIEYRKSSGVFRFSPPVSWIFHYFLLGDIIALCRKKNDGSARG
jgi:2-polyprenyl-3-methyl-5-hydroxy-6-metoxy-1,4-benzoquinol methylase